MLYNYLDCPSKTVSMVKLRPAFPGMIETLYGKLENFNQMLRIRFVLYYIMYKKNFGGAF